jgi:hypothetical protein
MAGLSTLKLVMMAAVGVAVTTLLVRLVRREPDPVIARLIVFGFVAKIAGTFAFQFVFAEMYGGRGDTNRYFRVGSELAPLIRSGTLPEQASEVGTPFMEFLAGALFAVTGSNRLVGNFVFSMLGFAGMYLLLQAYRLAVPGGNHRRYACLILLLPTLIFWSSTLGKEAWMTFTLGVAGFGGARLLRRERFGYALTAAGLVGMYMIRPHIAALFAVSLACAYLLRFRDPTVRRGAAAWLLGLAVMSIGVGYITSNYAEELRRDESVEGSATEQVFAATTRSTSQGESQFESRQVRGPGDFLYASVSVPFRPFPYEAHNPQALITSLEGVLLMGLVLLAIPRLWRLPFSALRTPYIALSTVYVIGFIIAFSNVANFGLLTRQRVQLIPFLLVLLTMPVQRDAGTRNVEAGEPGERGRRRSRPLVVFQPPQPGTEGASLEDHPAATDENGPERSRRPQRPRTTRSS